MINHPVQSDPRCTYCDAALPPYQGKGRRRSCCDTCRSNRTSRKESDRARRISNREVLNEAKDAPCVDCGQKFPPAAMDLHHRDPAEKRFSPTYGVIYSEAAVRAEIAKCIVLCAICHRLRHHEET